LTYPVPSLHSAVSVFAGSRSQPVLTQPSFLSASLGTTARLTCTLSRDINVGSYTIYWYQQMPGSSPRYLLYYSSSTQLGSGVSNRFSGSKDSSANAGLLLISGLQPENEADYYCAVWASGSSPVSFQEEVLPFVTTWTNLLDFLYEK
uniref:Ig-like domain-containing protein n=1 Tax=Suricata suricatta TaxID=37032 RepID=A0A673UHY3_SURSU